MPSRKNFVAAAFALPNLFVVPAYAVDLTGTWQVAIDPMTCTLMPKGKMLSGSCSTMVTGGQSMRIGATVVQCTLSSLPIKMPPGTCKGIEEAEASGSVDGKNIKWISKITWGDGLFGIREFSGQWDLKNDIRGKITYRWEVPPPPQVPAVLPPDSGFTANRLAGNSWRIIVDANMTICDLIQKGDALSGRCHARQDGAIVGSVSGKIVKWTWTTTSPRPGWPDSVREFSGQWDLKNAISGNITFKTGDQTPPSSSVAAIGASFAAQLPSDFIATRQAGK